VVMIIVGFLLWTLVLCFLLNLLKPTPILRDDTLALVLHYLIAPALIAFVLYIHYRILTSSHHKYLAISEDIVGLTVYLAGALLFAVIRHRGTVSHHTPDLHDTEAPPSGAPHHSLDMTNN
jgi:hypothetical protein